jgi:hypothetical protein
MLDKPTFAQRAIEVAQVVRQENGVKQACDALEELWRSKRQTN